MLIAPSGQKRALRIALIAIGSLVILALALYVALHVALSAFHFWSPVLRWLRVIAPIDAQRAHNITNAYSLAFFNRHLLGQAAVLLDGPASQYPDVLFDSRQP